MLVIKPRVALVASVSMDLTGTHRANLHQLKAFLDLDGFDVHVFLIRTQTDLNQLVSSLRSTRYVWVHCEQGHFMGLTLDGEFLFDRLNIPVFTQLRDHWFYPWVWKNLKSLPINATVFHTSEFFTQAQQQMNGSHYHCLHTTQLYKTPISSAFSKPIDIFYSGTCRSIEDAYQLALETSKTQVIDHVMESCHDACQIPDWVWELTLVDDQVEIDGERIQVTDFYKLFELARTIVRSNILNRLATYEALIFVKGGWLPPKGARAQCINRPLPFAESNYLASRAKCVFSDQATFKNEIGERVATALDSGVPIIARCSELLEPYRQLPQIRLYDSLDSLEDCLVDRPINHNELRYDSTEYPQIQIRSYLRGVQQHVFE